jgi:predicted acylesterase/phospholipase RssA
LEVGALQALEVFAVLRSVRRVVGVSVGAALGLLLVAGYGPAKIAKLALAVDLSRDIFSLGKGNFVSRGGLFSLEGCRSFLSELITRKFGGVPSLRQLWEITGMELVTVSTNVTACEPLYISKETLPELSCVEAVLMSINIPLVFEYYLLGGQRYADGALTDPLPIQLCPDEDQVVLRIVDTASQQDGFLSYVYSAFSTTMDYAAKEKLRRMMGDAAFRRRCRVIDLTTQNFMPVNPAMPDEEKQNMINQGRKTAAEAIILEELSSRRNVSATVGRPAIRERAVPAAASGAVGRSAAAAAIPAGSPAPDADGYRVVTVHPRLHVRGGLRPLPEFR